MKRIPFLFLICFLISSLLCGGLCFVPSQVSAEDVSPLAEGSEQHFDDAETFAQYINSYSALNANDNIVLDADLDMTGQVLTNTIGTRDAAFCGTFNGNGYIISNLEIRQDGAGTEDENARRVYAGLFGFVKGEGSKQASIQNVGFAGSLKITVENYSTTAYVGTLVAWAENANIQYIQMTADVTLNADFSKNLIFGGIAANISNGCRVRGVICRPTSFGFWEMKKKDSCILEFGGLFGHCEGSFVTFSVVDVPFELTISDDFGGKVKLGGVAGTLDQMQIDNVAIDNEYILEGASNNLIVGEVVGEVLDSDDGSLSYIYYKQNSGISIFGDKGFFNFVQSSDHIEQSLQDLNSLTPMGSGYSYFEEKHWHPLRDKWDFQKEFFVGSSKILLQSFYGDFHIAFQNQNPTVISCSLDNAKTYRYGQSATMPFVFNNSEEANMIDYYDIKALSLNGSQVASIKTTAKEDGSFEYSFSGLEDRFSITTTSNGFEITILSINNSLAGNYSLTIQPKDFTINLTTRLFESRESNDFLSQDQDGKNPILPGDVFKYNQNGTKNLIQHLTGPIFDTQYTLDTERKTGTFYTHFGWCILYEDGGIENLDASEATGSLTITFGRGHFTKQALLGEDGQRKISAIVAKYIDDACKVTFLLGEGIDRVELYSGRTVIDDVQTLVPISKTADITMSIYIRDGFQFDTEKFIEYLATYAGGSNESGFCMLEQEVKNADENYYVFRLDMKKLLKEFQGEWTIDVKADIIEVDHLVWLWWTLGALGCLLVIGLVVFLIVFLVRRRGSGGSSKKIKAPTRKTYKGMYY